MGTVVVFSIGSNLANSRVRVELALRWLDRHFDPTIVSSVYSTPELSGRFADYNNAIAIGHTTRPKEDIEKQIKDYERSCGRTSASKSRGLVAIDIDLVAFDNRPLRPKELNRDYFKIGWQQLEKFLSQKQDPQTQNLTQNL